MLAKPIYCIILLCLSFSVSAQTDDKELESLVAAVQNAFDVNSDSMDFFAGKANALAIKTGNMEARLKIARLHADKFFVNGESDKAVKIVLDAARIAEKYPATAEKTLLYYFIAQVYSKNQAAAVSEKYLRKGLDFARELKHDVLIADGYNRLGIMYEKRGAVDSALYFYQLAFDSNNEDMIGKAYSLENIAGIYALKNDLRTALAFQKQSLFYKMQTGKKIHLAICYMNIAETFDRMKQFDSTVYYTMKAIELASEIRYRDLTKYGHGLLSSVYEQRGDFKKALDFHKQYYLLNDTIYNENLAKQLAEQNAKYQVEKHQQQIKELNQQATIQKLELKQKNSYLLIAAGLLLAGAAIVYLANNRRKFKEQARLQAEINRQQSITTREVLFAEEKERKRIAADLHDGVGQLLSATLMNLDSLFHKMNIDRRSDTEADRVFGLVTQSYDELRAISHQMMPNALLKAGLGAGIKELISGIDSNKLAIAFESEGLNDRLNEEVETVLYRVIQESINNVIKHANATRLNIQIINDEDGIAVTIEDNGTGFDIKTVKKNGIGLKNMYSRVQLQNGTVDIDSQPGKGTLVAIHIPVPPPVSV